MEAAVDWLRKKGLSKAAKKAGNVAAEGLVGVAAHGGTGAVVEVNSQTDFVARNDQNSRRSVAKIAETRAQAPTATSRSLAQAPFPAPAMTVEGGSRR